ncbi:hypothetical protein BT93_H2299 [Corymbia citriodora subsp. variegata]|nr:hypothetical protein BT93_H2299 [Corymbia citriodora subsp. variegata]
MNHYHIYEAIGRGKHSTVYKGRKKKTIEYFAIKSVDKSQKSKVLQEVRILHSLDHPNVLKFYSWYETSAHLWLVLEYCVGGDLITLLRQDGRLPEDSIHDLAADLVKALQYIHSQGIIYCDLKPSNILLDENGHTKLCDFGLARKLSDISKIPSASLPQAKRGTPCYMAPELFEDGGVHSYASDFWALGCVLYECYTGRPPFLGQEFTQLVRSILTDPTPPLPGTPSRPFVNLINSLLIKDPAERIKWSELCGHAFWRAKCPSVPLPPQPAFDSMIELHTKPCLSEFNGERSVQNKTPPRHREKDAKVGLRRDENSIIGTKGHDTPVKAAQSGRKNHAKTSGKGGEEKHKDNSSGTRALNLLRLSRIAKSNLQKENEKENYRRPLPSGAENDSEVKIENTDMELDFNENTEEDAQEELDGSDIPSPAIRSSNENLNHEGQVEEMDIDEKVEPAAASDLPLSDESKTMEQESYSELTQVAATPPSVSPLPKGQRAKESLGSAHESDSAKSASNIVQAFWHQSDLSVRPVMPSRKSDRTSEVIPSLPFEALQAPDFVKMSKGKLDALNNKIISILSGSTGTGEKQNVIKYLEMLSSYPDAANVLTNGPIMLMLIKMLRQSKASVLRVQLASLIGLLIRHCTFIEDDLSNSGILGSLTDSLGDRQEKVRRFSMAALGELLFYISTQNEQKENMPSESPSKENRSTITPTWQVPNSLISLVTSILRKGEDDMTQLYALRTIENICSQGGYWAARFTSQDVINNLCYIYKASGKPESMRLTAGSCLVRLVRFNPPSIQSVLGKLSCKDMTSALVKGGPREQQICLNLLIMTMTRSNMLTNSGRHLLPIAEDKNLVLCLISLIEQGPEVIKGKALVLVALLCKNSRKWLFQLFYNMRLISIVDRLTKEKDSFVQQCLNASVHVVASTIPNLLETLMADIQQMMGGRRHGPMSPLTGRAAQKTNNHLFPVILNLLGSPYFKHKVATHQVRHQLANIVKLMENPFQGRDDFQLTVLRVVESITEESSWILESSDVFIRGILPSLAVLYKGNKDGDARFLSLKILFDVMVVFLNEPPELEHKLEDLKSISNVQFLPLYPTLIEDEDPIPMYAQKLLLMLIEFNLIKIPDILQPKTVSHCFRFLLGDLSIANVNDVKLCVALASAPEMDPKLLSQLKVVRRIGNLLEFVHVKDMEDFLEPTLGLCKAFLLRSLGFRVGSMYTQEPTLLDESSSEAVSTIRDITDFGGSAGVFLELSGSPDGNNADIASECMVLLLKAAPREGAAGFLTNLSKVSVVLQSWQKGAPSLLVLRMLHSLGYSCRQYLLHRMILSVCTSEIAKIEGIVSEIKYSGAAALASAATLVISELRRLPHRG